MHPKKQRSILRALTRAYYEYRDLKLLQVCRKARIRVWSYPNSRFGGNAQELDDSSEWDLHYAQMLRAEGKVRQATARERQARRAKLRSSKYDWAMQIAGRCPTLYKEHLYWHEFCHVVLTPCHILSRRIGYQGQLQQFDEDGLYWVEERLCNAFADLMIVYRAGLLDGPANLEAFFFEDSSSIGYAEVGWYSVRRLERHIEPARVLRKNNLSELEAMMKHLEHEAYSAEHQQMLPTAFYEHHQCPGPRFVDEQEDFERRYQFSKDKEGWVDVLPFEQRLRKMLHVLIDDLEHGQLTLFPERAKLDRQKIEAIRKRLQKWIGPITQNPAS